MKFLISGMQKAFQIVVKSLGGLVILMSFGGCVLWPVNKKDVIGTYQIVLQDGTPGLPDGGSEILELKPDGTCIQQVSLKSGKFFSTQGTWEWKSYERYYIRNIIITGIYWTVIDGDKMNPDLEKSLPRVVQGNPVGRTLTGRILLGSREAVHYEKK